MTAHPPFDIGTIEQNDTANYLTLISMLHKKLDKSFKVRELN